MIIAVPFHYLNSGKAGGPLVVQQCRRLEVEQVKPEDEAEDENCSQADRGRALIEKWSIGWIPPPSPIRPDSKNYSRQAEYPVDQGIQFSPAGDGQQPDSRGQPGKNNRSGSPSLPDNQEDDPQNNYGD